MKCLWIFVGKQAMSIYNLQKEKDTLEKKLDELNAYNRWNNIELRNAAEDIQDHEVVAD